MLKKAMENKHTRRPHTGRIRLAGHSLARLVMFVIAGTLCSNLGMSQNPIPTIPYTEPAPVVDGLGTDWPQDSLIRFTQANHIPANANSVSVQFAWDEQYLYLYAEVYDAQVIRLTTDSNLLYLNDAVELYIDPLDDSGKRMDINDYQFIVDNGGEAAVLKGDKSSILDSSKVAPKELGIATVAFQKASRLVEAAEGHGPGFAVEMAIPFAGLGAVPRAGMRLKIDFCVDDVDSLVDLATIPDGGHLPGFFASNWDDYRDFSFPDHWREFSLAGGPSMQQQIAKDLLPYWIWIVLGLVMGAASIIGWQGYRIRQLRDVLPRSAVRPALMRELSRGEAARSQPPLQTMAGTDEPPIAMEDDRHANEQAPFPDASDSQSVTETNAGSLAPQIERCRQYVLAHLDQELKMEDLAAECALSLRTLQRLFKDEMDMSPGNFVVLIKMERAAELLRGGQCNVSEAAWQLGFSDSSYFSRVFKKYHGLSPREFLG